MSGEGLLFFLRKDYKSFKNFCSLCALTDDF